MMNVLTTPSDELLLLQMSQGSNEAFSELYDKHWETAFANAYRRLKNTDQAKDVVQDIFTNLWLRRESLTIANFEAYLHVAIRNQVLKLVEKNHNHVFFNGLENIASLSSEADTHLLWKEFAKSYDRLIEGLPRQRQIIFRLRFQEDMPTKVIAAALHLSRKTVQNQLGKAIDQLKGSLSHILFVIIFPLAVML